MAILFLFGSGPRPPARDLHMGVDVTQDELPINLDAFPGLPCQIISLDALDASGKHEADIGASSQAADRRRQPRARDVRSHYEDFEPA